MILIGESAMARKIKEQEQIIRSLRFAEMEHYYSITRAVRRLYSICDLPYDRNLSPESNIDHLILIFRPDLVAPIDTSRDTVAF